MDRVKVKKRKAFFKNKTLMISGALLLALLILWSGDGNEVQRSDIRIATVEKGNIEEVVDGYGELRSSNEKLITAMTEATVVEILKKPGAVVKPSTVIVKLESPRLKKELENSRKALVTHDANFRQLKLAQKQNMLSELVILTNYKSEYDSAELNLAAQQQLHEIGSTSSIQLKTASKEVDRLEKLIIFQKEKIRQLEFIEKEQLNIQQSVREQLEGDYKLLLEEYESLNMVAGMDGVLQQQPISLGQNVMVGQEVARIGSASEMLAFIIVSQSKINKVALGNEVAIKTRHETLNGIVRRIDPIVENNNVTVEVEILNLNGKTVRPLMRVDAKIFVDTVTNVLKIAKPSHIQQGSEAMVYKLDSETSDVAHLTKLQFGRHNGKEIEIKSDVNSGDKLIITELQPMTDKTIRILN